jgi:GT2 family glycosyltransferase
MSAGAATPDLSVVMVTHNGCEMALQTLRSALASTGPIEVEWTVVDAHSTDGTPDAIEREFPEVTVRRRANRGFAASNNVGLREARGRYVLLLNPDVEIRTGSLALLVEAMDARPEVGAASVIQRGTNDEFQASIRRFPSPARSLGEGLFAAYWPTLNTMQELETRRSVYAREHLVDWIVGSFLIVRREVVEEVGLMDERYFLYSEEIDWCYRFWQAGRPVAHLPLMTITHHAGGRSHGDLMAQLTHSRMLFLDKHYDLRRRLGVRAALAFKHASRVAIYGALSPLRPSLRERVGAEWKSLRITLGVGKPPLAPEPEPVPFETSAPHRTLV